MIPRYPTFRATRFSESQRYTGEPIPPTPEQLLDDGRVDGIPVVTPAEAARLCADRLREIGRNCIGYRPRTRTTANAARTVLDPVGGGQSREFVSMKAAARALGISEGNVRAKLRRQGGIIGGYRWRIGV